MLVHVFPFLLVVQTATIWTTVLVGLNRYIAVCLPYQAMRLCTVPQAKRQLAVVILFSAAYNLPRFAEGRLEYEHSPPGDGRDEEGEEWVACAVHTDLAENAYYRIVYSNVMYTVFVCVLPLLILTALNVRLITALNVRNRKRNEMSQSVRQKQDNNVTFVLIVVVIVFSVCQFPALLTQIFWTVLSDAARSCGGFQFYFSRISNLLVTANSALNFIIHFSFNQRFRAVLGDMFQHGGPGQLVTSKSCSKEQPPRNGSSPLIDASPGGTGVTVVDLLMTNSSCRP